MTPSRERLSFESMEKDKIICGDSIKVERSLFQVREGGAVPTSPHQLFFRPINYLTAMLIVKKHHYLHRQAPTTWAFGAYFNNYLEGVCTIGKPASHTLIEGVAGKENAKKVFELNRLWLSDKLPKNSESRFLGWVLRQIPKGTILVSYADTAQGHIGIVYKATNWIPCGTSIPFTDYSKNGLDHRSIPKGQRDKTKLIAKKRTIKNRYVYFTDKNDMSKLKWKILN